MKIYVVHVNDKPIMTFTEKRSAHNWAAGCFEEITENIQIVAYEPVVK